MSIKKPKIRPKMLTSKKLSAINNNINIHGPLTANLCLKSSKRDGKVANNILEPSHGGNGIKLKTPRTRLINII